MALLMHQSLNDCALSLWRKGATKLAIECCFFMSASIDKCKTVQAAIRQAGFIELNHSVYSTNIALTNCHPLSNLKKFVRGKNFIFDDEPVTTVEDHLTGWPINSSHDNSSHSIRRTSIRRAFNSSYISSSQLLHVVYWGNGEFDFAANSNAYIVYTVIVV